MKLVLLLSLSFCAACASGAQSAPPASSGAQSPPSAPTAAAVSPHQREERASATLDRLAAKDFTGAREWFDATMLDQLTVERIRDTWAEVESQVGPCKSHALDGATRIKGYISLEYDVVFEKGHMTARVMFDDDGKVAGLFLLKRAQ
jgi:hypothetical protein